MWQGIHHQARIVYSSALRHLLHSLPADLFVSSLALVQTPLKPDVRRPWPRLTSNKVNPLVALFFFSPAELLLFCRSCDWSPALPQSQIRWKYYFLLQKHWLDCYLENTKPLLFTFTVQVLAVQVFPIRINLLKTNESQWRKQTLIFHSHRLSQKCKV